MQRNNSKSQMFGCKVVTQMNRERYRDDPFSSNHSRAEADRFRRQTGRCWGFLQMSNPIHHSILKLLFLIYFPFYSSVRFFSAFEIISWTDHEEKITPLAHLPFTLLSYADVNASPAAQPPLGKRKASDVRQRWRRKQLRCVWAQPEVEEGEGWMEWGRERQEQKSAYVGKLTFTRLHLDEEERQWIMETALRPFLFYILVQIVTCSSVCLFVCLFIWLSDRLNVFFVFNSAWMHVFSTQADRGLEPVPTLTLENKTESKWRHCTDEQ